MISKELLDKLYAERDEFAKEIRHLSLRQSDLLTERDRYREALEAIIDEWSAEAEGGFDVHKMLRIAKQALED